MNKETKYRLKKETLLPSQMGANIIPAGYEVKWNGHYYEGKGGWLFTQESIDRVDWWEEVPIEDEKFEFIWDDKLAVRFAFFVLSESPELKERIPSVRKLQIITSWVEKFKTIHSKSDIEDEIRVVGIGKYQKSETFDSMFSTNKEFPNEKYPLIKQAIENILNEDTRWENPPSYQKYYTEADLDKAREESAYNAFKAAREGRFTDELKRSSPYEYLRYPTFQDYLDSLKK